MAAKQSRVKSTMGGKKSGKKSKAKRHVSKMELRHAANGGYIATHKHLDDQPEDQPEEHPLENQQSMLDHVDEHMSVPAPQPQAAPVAGA